MNFLAPTTVQHSGPRTQKPRGRSAASRSIADAALAELREQRPQTLRQAYYRLVSTGHLPKTEAAYRKLKGLLRDLREEGTLPWAWLADHTRFVLRSRTFDGIEGLLADSAALYRADLMRRQSVAIQVWAESDSIGSVIAEVADGYSVPVFVGRGYGARGYLWSAAQDIVAALDANKTMLILHVGDHDPSGEDIARDVQETLRRYTVAGLTGRPVREVERQLGPEELADLTTDVVFERLALTSEQINAYDLPVRPVKATDSRSAGYTGVGAVEVEALPRQALLDLVEDAIVSELDLAALEVAEEAERSERDIARRIAATPLAKLLAAAR